jgi:two-component system invasion response regulator UvrY
MPSVLLADPHVLVRQALRRVVEEIMGDAVVAEAGNCAEVLALSKGNCPDWLIMEPATHPVAMLYPLYRLRCSCEHTRIMLITSVFVVPFMERAFQAGMNACLSKSNSVAELAEAFEAVERGRKYVSASLAQSMLCESTIRGDQPAIQKLTNRELQIMHLLVQDKKVDQIARFLCLSPKTVSTYRYRIFDKLEVRNDVALTHIARKHGMLGEKISRQYQAA